MGVAQWIAASPRRGLILSRTSRLFPRCGSAWLGAGLLCVWLAAGLCGTANARGGGITGLSRSGCDGCHGGGATPTVMISGPASLMGGETGSFTFSLSGGAGNVCGLDVSSDIGTLAAIVAGTRLQNGEITHDVPRVFSSGTCSFDFEWTAPILLGNAIARLDAAGLSADGSGGTSGDRSALTSVDVSVVGSRIPDLIGQRVDLAYNFGNDSGTLTATVGAGNEFILEGDPTNPGLSTGTIDITPDALTLTHNRVTRLGPGLPVISDDFLTFTFPNLPSPIESVIETADPMPEWFDGLAFTGNSLTLTQLLDNAGVNSSLKTWSIALTAIEIREVARLIASDGAMGDEFGGSVALAGDAALIGARTDDDGVDSGAAYVFRFDGTTWVEEAKLTASDAATIDLFAAQVALSGDTALIASEFDDDNGNDSGSAYIFRFDGTAWLEEAKLTASDGSELDMFGASVALDGNTAVIGAPADDDDGSVSGSAYVFRYNGVTWVEETKLRASDAAAGDAFGAVAVWGDLILVGASSDDDNGSRSGSGYVFRYDGMTWAEEAKLTASDGVAFDFLGHSVALDGDTAVLAAAEDDTGRFGSVYVFRNNGAWIEEAKLQASDRESEDNFGGSIAIDGDTIWIGAPGAGSAYVFFYNGSSWVQQAKARASDSGSFNGFGGSVAVDGRSSLIGAIGASDAGISSGAAYVWSVPEPSEFGLHLCALAVLVGLTRRARRRTG